MAFARFTCQSNIVRVSSIYESTWLPINTEFGRVHERVGNDPITIFYRPSRLSLVKTEINYLSTQVGRRISSPCEFQTFSKQY